ncbi:MAG: prenyltransferase/squalene oxidase repeat-containing protein [Verrucomicrobiota bacterium]
MQNHDSDEDDFFAEEHSTPIKPKKPSFWSKIGGGSLMIAAVIHAVLFIAGGLWVYQVIIEAEKKVDFMPAGGGGGGERGSQTKVQQKKRQQITPSTNVKRVFAEGATSSYSIPDPGDSFGEMSALSSLGGGSMGGGGLGGGFGQGFGKGDGLGSGIGKGGGAGKLFGLIPETMRKRCSKEDRLQRLRDNGGTPACEEATLKGLRWLKSKQSADGSWPGNTVGYTGFVLLAYLGHCETPASEEFGDSCLKGIVYLINRGMKNNGLMATNLADKHWPYEHAIATYALAEALTFCKEMKLVVPNLREVTEKAGQFIIDNQHKNGGWAYAYSTADDAHVDTSVTGFQVQALKACSHTGIQFKGMQPTINKALNYVNGNQDESGGYGYSSTKSIVPGYHSLTGAGMLANQMWGKGNRSEVRKGAEYILKNSKFTYDDEWADLYAHYYESQAMMQMGGEYWEKYNLIFRDQVLKGQNPDGSWRMPGGGKKVRAVGLGGNQIYHTVLCTLMLEVYYRFLSTDGGGKRQPGI